MEYGIIYVLRCPFTLRVKYVGQTKVPIYKRLAHHIIKAYTDDFKSSVWIKNLLDNGELPIIEQIEKVHIDQLDLKEVEYIQMYRAGGCDLTNIQYGGQRKRELPPELLSVLMKTSYKKGHKQPQELIDRRRDTLKRTWANNPQLAENNRIRNAKKKFMQITKEQLYNILIIDKVKNTEAAAHFGCKVGTIERLCRRFGIYKNEKKKGKSQSIVILHSQTGIFYSSLREAAEQVGVCRVHLGNMLSGHSPNWTPFQKV